MNYHNRTYYQKFLFVIIKAKRWQAPLNCGQGCTNPEFRFATKLLLLKVAMTKNPQLEDGYTPIANELLDALSKIRIPGEAGQCLHFIIRKTYGYGKKEDWIALSQFVEGTNLLKPTVSRALRKLLDMNMIIKKDNSIGVNYGLQKNYDKWKPLSKKITVIKKDNEGSTKKIIRGSTKKIPTKDIYYNNNITKDIPFLEIVEHLNKVTQKDFRYKSKKTQSMIVARWNEGFRFDDFRYVHAIKAEEWLESDMEKYLRPETLYSNKFEGYRNQKPKQTKLSPKLQANAIQAIEWLRQEGVNIGSIRQNEVHPNSSQIK